MKVRTIKHRTRCLYFGRRDAYGNLTQWVRRDIRRNKAFKKDRRVRQEWRQRKIKVSDFLDVSIVKVAAPPARELRADGVFVENKVPHPDWSGYPDWMGGADDHSRFKHLYKDPNK